MHQLHIEEACLVPDWKRLNPQRYDSFVCTDCLSVYETNMERANGILMLPGYSFMSGGHWQSCSSAVAKKILGTLNPSKEEFENNREVMNAAAATARQHALSIQTPESKVKALFSACHNIEVFSYEFIPLHDWLHSVLQSAVIQAWTAFEVLAEDLHSFTRQAYSMYFRPEDYASKYYFQKRDKMRFSYERAFMNDSDIGAALGDRKIDELSLLRNLIVHNRGIVDEKFRQQCEDAIQFVHSTPENTILLKEWSNLPIQHEFMFDGLLVRSVLDGTQAAAYQLLSAVDKWVTTHSPT